MSMGLVPVGAMSIVAPPRNYERVPWVLDETIPRYPNPREVMNERAKERLVERAKNKPDVERNFMDYLILAQDKLENTPVPVMYMA